MAEVGIHFSWMHHSADGNTHSIRVTWAYFGELLTRIVVPIFIFFPFLVVLELFSLLCGRTSCTSSMIDKILVIYLKMYKCMCNQTITSYYLQIMSWLINLFVFTFSSFILDFGKDIVSIMS